MHIIYYGPIKIHEDDPALADVKAGIKESEFTTTTHSSKNTTIAFKGGEGILKHNLAIEGQQRYLEAAPIGKAEPAYGRVDVKPSSRWILYANHSGNDPGNQFERFGVMKAHATPNSK